MCACTGNTKSRMYKGCCSPSAPAYKIGQEVLLDGYTNSRRYYNGKRGNIVAVPDAARTYYVVELWDTRRRTYARPPNMSIVIPTVTAEGAAARALHWCHNLEMCIKHYLQGGEVQQKTRGSGDETYVDMTNPSWGSSYEYRIKPKPLEADVWVCTATGQSNWWVGAMQIKEDDPGFPGGSQWRKVHMREVLP